MIAKTSEDIASLKEIGRIVANCLIHMGQLIEVGMSTYELDQIGCAFLEAKGAKSAPIVCYNFPGTTCISIGHEVAHGIPSKTKLVKSGDIINIDVSAVKNGYFGDNGGSFLTGEKLDHLDKLCEITKEALWAGIGAARAGEKISSIGKAIEKVAHSNGYTVIENLGSHGIGKKLHEEPQFIAGFFDPSDRRILKENQVITIEPFISTGATQVMEDNDKWTLKTDPHIRSAQFEHTMIITRGEPFILTSSPLSIPRKLAK